MPCFFKSPRLYVYAGLCGSQPLAGRQGIPEGKSTRFTVHATLGRQCLSVSERQSGPATVNVNSYQIHNHFTFLLRALQSQRRLLLGTQANNCMRVARTQIFDMGRVTA